MLIYPVHIYSELKSLCSFFHRVIMLTRTIVSIILIIFLIVRLNLSSKTRITVFKLLVLSNDLKPEDIQWYDR